MEDFVIVFLQGFMRDGQLLEVQAIDKMSVLHSICTNESHVSLDILSRHIPCTVIQGRYDVVCPVGSLALSSST
jgi:hypothetical protein